MGYHTDFRGAFKVTPPLKPEHKAYLAKFSETCRMKRNEKKASRMPDPEREAVGLPVGPQGCYFVGGLGFAGQENDPSVTSVNGGSTPPEGQPGLWCQWIPNEDGTAIQWDEGEKFYSYTEWLEYLIAHFLSPWGYVLGGWVEWCGEETGDTGEIVVSENTVLVNHRPIDWSAWNNDTDDETEEPKRVIDE